MKSMIVLGDSPSLMSDIELMKEQIDDEHLVVCANRSCIKYPGRVDFVCSLHHWDFQWFKEWRETRQKNGWNDDFKMVTRYDTTFTDIVTGEPAIDSGFCVDNTGLYAVAFCVEQYKAEQIVLCGFEMRGRHFGFVREWNKMWTINWQNIRSRLIFANDGFRDLIKRGRA